MLSIILPPLSLSDTNTLLQFLLSEYSFLPKNKLKIVNAKQMNTQTTLPQTQYPSQNQAILSYCELHVPGTIHRINKVEKVS